MEAFEEGEADGTISSIRGVGWLAVPRGRGENLTDSEREAFGEQALLMHAQGKTYREIAQALGVSRPTVKGLIDRALEKTREERDKAKARQLVAYRALLGEAWARLSAMGVRTVTGLDMEAATIATVAETQGVPDWLVVKGVMDHADPAKDDRYKRFAARASAEVLYALLDRRAGRSPNPAARNVRPENVRGVQIGDHNVQHNTF